MRNAGAGQFYMSVPVLSADPDHEPAIYTIPSIGTFLCIGSLTGSKLPKCALEAVRVCRASGAAGVRRPIEPLEESMTHRMS